jgi:hypothetical protein
MNNYEVVDLFEVGDAGTIIMEKGVTDFDELGDLGGAPEEALNE